MENEPMVEQMWSYELASCTNQTKNIIFSNLNLLALYVLFDIRKFRQKAMQT